MFLTKKHIIIYLLVFSNVITLAQKEVDLFESSFKYDTNYIKSYADHLAIKFYGIVKQNDFELFDKIADTRIKYKPNEDFNIGLGLNYKWLGLSAAFNLKSINKDDKKYGTTERLDFRINIYGRKIIADGGLQFYKGYYISNPSSYIYDWDTENPFPQRNDIATYALRANIFYSFNNEKFSYRACFVQNELQKKSAGSFIFGGYFTFFGLYADSSIVPFELRDTLNNNLNLFRANAMNIGLAAGYIYTVAIKEHFAITISLLSGISRQSFEGETPDHDTIYNESKLAAKLQTRLAVGYNGDKFFAGLSYIGDHYSLNETNESALNTQFGIIKIYVGTRFRFGRKTKPL